MSDQDWENAERILYTNSVTQVTRFLGEVDCGDLYGFGFFSDPVEGVMPVANFQSFHDAEYRDSLNRLAKYDPETRASLEEIIPSDEETFRWNIGNWKYPGGLDVAYAHELEALDDALERLRSPESEEDDDSDRERLDELCIRVLTRLHAEGIFSAARNLEGFVILAAHDEHKSVLPRKRSLDWILHPLD